MSATWPDNSLAGSDGPVVVAVDADIDLLSLHQAYAGRYPHLLESVAHGNPQARFDILFAVPGDTMSVDATGVVSLNGCATATQGFLGSFDRWWRQEQTGAGSSVSVPFRGGWFVYLGYELVAEIEPRVAVTSPDGVLPAAFATRFHAAIIRDRETGRVCIVAEPAYADCVHRIAEDIAECRRLTESSVAALAFDVAEDDPRRFLDGVQRIKNYIRDGDVFQVNLSRAWRVAVPSGVGAADIYRRLRITNPAPFSGIATWKNSAIICSSPERLVHVTGEIVQTRPIAGTRPRGLTSSDDSRLSATLLAHPKERAEHVMLIDLERNDIGRICAPGTVRVDELMVLESYAHVHHIVSNVTGRLKDKVTPGEIIRAVFPGGTITGCPKVRCMEIIAELEQAPRGPYTGSFGYINCDGSLDLNILIRTLIKQGNSVTFRTGAGIVADSVPEYELDETRAKARGLLLAMGQGLM